MTTRIKVPRAQWVQQVLWIAAMLLVSVVASGKSMQASRCPGQKPGAAATVATREVAAPAAADAAVQSADERPAAVSASTGLDLEVRIWNVRIGFPWLKSLPLTPGRRIVVSLWEAESDR